MEITSSNFSNHSALKLENNTKKNFGNYTDTSKLNSLILSNQWIKKEIKKEI